MTSTDSRRLTGLLTCSAAVALALTGAGGSAVADPSPNPHEILDGSLVYNGSFDVADGAGHPIRWSVEGQESGASRSPD